MKFLIWLVLLFATLPVFGALTDFDRQEISFKNLLAAKNGGFESGKANWTASGGTFTTVNSGSNLLVGKNSGTWDSSGAGQTLTSATITLEKGYYGRNCEGALLIQTPSGSATHLLELYDGTNILVSNSIISSTTPSLVTVYAPCPTSGTLALRLKSVASDEPLVAVDDGHLGIARNIGNVANVTPSVSWTPAGSWSTNTTYTGQKWRVADRLKGKIHIALAGAPTSAGLTVNLPSECVIDTAKLSSGTITGQTLGDGFLSDANGSDYPAWVRYSSTTALRVDYADDAASGLTFTGNVTATAPFTFAISDTVAINFDVPCVGWSSEQAFRPEQMGWFVDVNIAGASPSLGVTNVSSYTEITDAGLTMTPKTGSAAAGVMCSSTNAATSPTTSTSTCAAGSESLGFNASIPVVGWYEVCAYFSHYMAVDSGETVQAAFEVIETPTNAQTLTQEGGSRIVSRHSGMTIATGTGSDAAMPHTNCGFFNLTSTGIHGFRLMFEQSVSGTPNASQILADASASVGQRDVRFTMRPVTPSAASPILLGSITSSQVGALRMESAKFGSTGTISQETGDWVNGNASVASAVYTITLNSSQFSSAPNCTVSSYGETTDVQANVESTSTSTIKVRTFNQAGSATAAAFMLMCMGPR